ncbi:protein STAY-GREEN, chloroplastic-like protein [Cinnamomum micranthum f. kanehirae]|uniref:Protein STAY-GREEN, chloroplastic-like protein n=1 Tax=Cinnamomum micranthum f. kanehirae TaxID=337451 RepID=A0A3S3MZR4_9MAGN|nr:protein STAY-GREEN, chloroplastic-like protein [Cinnamomum micranthum f. kanehirae]
MVRLPPPGTKSGTSSMALPSSHTHLFLPILPFLRKSSPFHYPSKNRAKRQRSIVPVARLFGRAIFEASKLKVLFLGVDEEKHPGNIPRTYTLTHSDITSKITLVISQTINRAQLRGWYNRLQRDEVVAEWKKVQGKMLRHYIFCKELPVVLKAFVHGDENLFSNYPELEEALVWVYFHSNLQEFNTVECWGPLKDAVAPRPDLMKDQFSSPNNNWGATTAMPSGLHMLLPSIEFDPMAPQDFEVDNKTS